MTAKELQTALKTGNIALGTLVASPSPFWPKIIRDCGLDFVFIDTEHIAIDREHLSWMCRAYAAMGLPPLVRIPDHNPNQATVALDDGAAGVIAPYVECAETARTLTGAAKLRPLKGRRLAETLAGRPLPSPLARYVEDNPVGGLLILNIESVPAMDALDKILEVEGIDAVLIGPHDLTTSLGIPEQYQHPAFLKAAETIFKKARNRKIGAGIHAWFSIKEQRRFVEMGANLLIHKADAIFFQQGITAEINELRKHLGLCGKEETHPKTVKVNI